MLKKANFYYLLITAMITISTLAYGSNSSLKEKQHFKDLKYQYAVKFICGKPDFPVVAPGEYFTAINVHNPNESVTVFRKKVAIALPSEKAGPISPFFKAMLKPDEALEIDCPDILGHAKTQEKFLKGFVVIESPHELDIVAVYTAGNDHVETLHTERVPYRFIGVPEKVKAETETKHCPAGGKGNQVGNEGCCCNKPRINPPQGDADWWPDCKPSLTCAGNLPGPGVPTSTYAVCVKKNKLLRGINPPLHWSQPAYCGQR